MKQSDADLQTYPPEEAQRRFEALIRATRRPPLHGKDVPRKRSESKRKVAEAAKPSPS